MILGTLWYMLEEMNTGENYEVIKVDIDENKQYGITVIRNLDSNIDEDWYWDQEIDIWIKEK